MVRLSVVQAIDILSNILIDLQPMDEKKTEENLKLYAIEESL